jgi:hypothetical protein
MLACATVTQPIKDAQNLAGTAQSFATALPIETLQSLATQAATQISASTLEAIPSSLPDFEGYFNPQGTPASEWKGIPIMSQATAGQEFTDTNTYSFKADASVKDVQDFYNAQLVEEGWSSLFSMPGSANGAVLAFQKDNNVLTVTIVDQNGSVIVVLTMA